MSAGAIVQNLLRSLVALAVTALAGQAMAADMPKPVFKAPAFVAPWTWTGFYAGLHAGTALGLSKISDPYGNSLYGDEKFARRVSCLAVRPVTTGSRSVRPGSSASKAISVGCKPRAPARALPSTAK